MKHLSIKLLFFVLPILQLQAQTNNLDSLNNLSAKDFDKWAFEYIESFEEEEPFLLRQVVLSRLSTDRFTSDAVILKLVECYEKYEQHKLHTNWKQTGINPLFEVGNRYKQMDELVDQLITSLYERSILEYKLKEIKIRLYSINHEFDKEIKLREQLVSEVEDSEFDLKVIIYKQSLALGNHYAKNSQTYKSEKNYSKILSNRFYAIKDPVQKRTIQELYLTAGKNILKLRENDLLSLKSTYFFPAAMPLLEPIKQEYLEKFK